MNEKIIEMIEGFVVDIMRQIEIPGMSIGIIQDGKPVYSKGFGAKNLERNEHMTPDSLFGIGSISKTFAALAIMQLVEQGKIDLYAPVSDYMDFKLGKKSNPITVHHFLSHSSGIAELTLNLHAIFRLLGSLEHYIPVTCWEDYLPLVNRAKSEVLYEPGERFMYNNDLYGCLGLIVENVSKMKYIEYIRENIFKPLGMTRSTYLKEELEKDRDVITGYLPSKDGQSLVPASHPFTEIVYAPGGMLSSVNELMKYMVALMDGGTCNGNRIIQEETLKKMWTLQITEPEEINKGYGYGWRIIKDFFGETIVEHGGDIVVSGGLISMIPEKKMGVVIAFNKEPTGLETEALSRGIYALLLGKDLKEAVPLLAAQQKLQMLTGKYQTYMGGFRLEVINQGGMLVLKAILPPRGEVTVPIAPENLDELKFFVPIALPGAQRKIQFFIDDKTRKVRLVFDRFNFHKL